MNQPPDVASSKTVDSDFQAPATPFMLEEPRVNCEKKIVEPKTTTKINLRNKNAKANDFPRRANTKLRTVNAIIANKSIIPIDNKTGLVSASEI